MPYINKPARERLDRGATPATLAELTYVITQQCCDLQLGSGYRFLPSAIETEILAYLAKRNVTYDDLVGVLGSLDAARREFKRRRSDSYLPVDTALHDASRTFYRDTVVPFLDTHRQTNGDVYE